MVLEEEIRFASIEQATKFSRLLRDLGISTQIRTRMNLQSRLMLSGESAALIEILKALISELNEEEDEEGYLPILEESIRKLLFQQEILRETFSNHSIGDTIGDSVLDLITGDDETDEESTEEDSTELLRDIFQIRLLHLNELVEFQGDHLVLIKSIEPEKAIMTLYSDEIPLIPDEILESNNIKTSLSATDEEISTVLISPEIVFIEDFTPITSFFDENPLEDDEDVKLVSRIQIKQVVITEILRLIGEGACVSRDELADLFEDIEISPDEDDKNTTIMLHISPQYVRAIIDDLKKSGYIRGKDQRLKLVI